MNIGAEASFFDLFGASTGETLLEKNFPLLQKCVGSTVVSPMLPESRRNQALHDGDDNYTPKSDRPCARKSRVSVGIGYTIRPASQCRHPHMISSERARACAFFLLGSNQILYFSFLAHLRKQKLGLGL